MLYFMLGFQACQLFSLLNNSLFCQKRELDSAQALAHPSAPECGLSHSYSFTFKNKTQFRQLRQDAVVQGIGQGIMFPFHYVYMQTEHSVLLLMPPLV